MHNCSRLRWVSSSPSRVGIFGPQTTPTTLLPEVVKCHQMKQSWRRFLFKYFTFLIYCDTASWLHWSRNSHNVTYFSISIFSRNRFQFSTQNFLRKISESEFPTLHCSKEKLRKISARRSHTSRRSLIGEVWNNERGLKFAQLCRWISIQSTSRNKKRKIN